MNIFVSLACQTLELRDDAGGLLRRYAVSTAKNGAGEQLGSYKTPRGQHIIRAKIGAGAAVNTVFVRRRPTGELWTPQLAAGSDRRDWILTRILWLSGCVPGFNRLGQVDTMRRFIYLHGSPDNVAMGRPGSIGCIRMRNADIVELFDFVPLRTPVYIAEYGVRTGAWAELGAQARPVREAVFQREQQIAASLDWDEADAVSRHVVVFDSIGAPIATGRLSADGRIGRVAVLPQWRGQQVGRCVLLALLDAARERGMATVWLHAQMPSAAFYIKLGFQAEGAVFMEAGIAHQTMRRDLL